MKTNLLTCLFFLLFVTGFTQNKFFVGSTPAHAVVREFLQINATDSIDFIRWKLELNPASFKLQCQYGLAKAGTPGFTNEQSRNFEGTLSKKDHYYLLQHKGRTATILEVNSNVLHFLDRDKKMLIGNGGYSYALNSTTPVIANAVSIHAEQTATGSPLVFEGRTPCNALPQILGIQKSDACNKMKWYFHLYTDSITGAPAHFLMGGIGYRKETMAKGNWKITTDQNGNTVYQLYFNQWARPLSLLKGDDNILFFIDNDGRLLVGNEDFSYTLNRRPEAYARIER
ncbi:hypothetical protein [Pseudocnuella soli]|uniref:hypothetical protein n=1 Tax=Pseudocnuella soli TaxID=2502779 RepID=UPI00104D6E56|nr:hypothetical protein [Pseudocnuella soli]